MAVLTSFNVHRVSKISVEHIEYGGRRWSRVIFHGDDAQNPIEIAVFAADGVDPHMVPEMPVAPDIIAAA